MKLGFHFSGQTSEDVILKHFAASLCPCATKEGRKRERERRTQGDGEMSGGSSKQMCKRH